MEWIELKALAEIKCKELSSEYLDRLKVEIKEIEKQGTNQYWADNYNKSTKWDHNNPGLILPFILGMTPIDPIKNSLKHQWQYQTDFPDIDLDFLPMARSTIKEYAVATFGSDRVCSVGNWNTFKPKLALQDTARALGFDVKEVIAFTANLPDEFDDLDYDDHKQVLEKLKSNDPKIRQEAHIEVEKYKAFYEFWKNNPKIVDTAFRLVGKIKSMGTHAGGVIIADRPIEHIVPLSRPKGTGDWTSQWTEGKSTQLSKFGLIKFDVLGLNTMQYVYEAGRHIEQTCGIKIDWADMDPSADPPFLGKEYHQDGTVKIILMNDPKALKMCNDLKTESVFQIETNFQKGIISNGKVKSFWDLVVYNALGRPGPMDMIPEYIKRRDDKSAKWRSGTDPKVIKILEETFGVIVYQEQLQAVWMELAKFTVPEAEAARKVIAKKWADKLKQVEEKWIKGATATVGEVEAKRWWTLMETFGRYAFNRAHSVAYSIVTYRCLYLKAHYPAQWWAAVLSECKQEKLSPYMSAARLDGVKFGNLDVDSLTYNFSIKDGKVIPGLSAIKGVGEKASLELTSVKGPFTDIDDFVEKVGKSKTIFERLIKLGAFDNIHSNRKGLWNWYQYKYCSTDDEIRALKVEINKHSEWTPEQIELERNRQRMEYKKLYPKRNKIPSKIEKWKPKKVELPRDEVINMYQDYTEAEKLKIEKELLGYYWNSPLIIYQHIPENSIEKSRDSGVMDVVIESITAKQAKTSGNKFYVFKVTDGIQKVDVTVWDDAYRHSDRQLVKVGGGIRINVDYNAERNNFKISNGTVMIPLNKRGANDTQEDVVVPDDYPLV